MARILDCKGAAQKLLGMTKENIESHGFHPRLAIISVGEDEPSKIYMRNKKRVCNSVGIDVLEIHYDSVSFSELVDKIWELNTDITVNGVMLQFPVIKELERTVDYIDFTKDVDGLARDHMHNPCTPDGIMWLLNQERIYPQGKHVVIVGRSKLVGKPLANQLIEAGATVTVCNSLTEDLGFYTRQADILVVAAGHPKLITADMVNSEKAVSVIDVGINRTENGICGDVDFENVEPIVDSITTVPGGVGVLTTAEVAFHTYISCLVQSQKK